MPKHDIKRLPKWAQELLAEKNRELDGLKNRPKRKIYCTALLPGDGIMTLDVAEEVPLQGKVITLDLKSVDGSQREIRRYVMDTVTWFRMVDCDYCVLECSDAK